MADCEKCGKALAAYAKASGLKYPTKAQQKILTVWHENGHPEVGADGPG